MNYYERHLGDYAKDTGHLSMLEHGAYTLLLDRYYSTEAGIPADQVHRIVRARSKEEKKAVDTVLKEFFVLESGIWINYRAEEEIERYRDGDSEREERKINQKERTRRHREERKRLFSDLRNFNVVPPYDINVNELRTLHKKVCNGHVTVTETSRERISNVDVTAIHNPDTIHHINTNSAATDSEVLGPADFPAATPDELKKPKKPPLRNIEISLLLRNLGVKPMTGQHPFCIELAQNPKATDDVLKAAVEHARQQKGEGVDIHPNYLKAILPDYLDPKPKKEKGWWASNEGIERKGRELGMQARAGEGYLEYVQRLHEEIRKRKGAA